MGLTGCTTLGNLSKLNTYMPVVEDLVYLQDYAASSGQTVSRDVCGEDLGRVARTMGWVDIRSTDIETLIGKPSAAGCDKYVFIPKK